MHTNTVIIVQILWICLLSVSGKKTIFDFILWQIFSNFLNKLLSTGCK